jgi:hypothetical protein
VDDNLELDGPTPVDDELAFNGVDVDTGSYLFPRMRIDSVARLTRGEELDPQHAADLAARTAAGGEDQLGVVYGRDPSLLSEVGWALVAADDVGPEIIEALAPLRDRRREQSADLYRELVGPTDGVHTGEDKQDFLIRHKVAAMDVVDPRKLPYYVLLVGSPDRVPFPLQYQLDVQYAVGRIHFDTPEEYARYAQTVVEAEKNTPAGRRAHVFATRNPGDFSTALSASRLAQPLVEDLQNQTEVGNDIGGAATKSCLADLLNGGRRVDVLFTATHGLGTAGSRQREIQGALLCQEWEGPGSQQRPITNSEYFAGADLDSDKPVSATVVFSFACYSAGTPHVTDFIQAPTAAATADPPFVSRLAQRLLSHPRGGCLAYVGHVDRAWNSSFLWKGIEPNILPFSTSIEAFLAGAPLGMAMEYINARYATTATELVNLLHQERAAGLIVDDRELARLWLATNDARNFVVVGDPAIRLTMPPPARP